MPDVLTKTRLVAYPQKAITLIEGLALQTPPRSMTAIHRHVVEIAKAQGWKPPSFVETKSYRRFGEMCDACRRARVIEHVLVANQVTVVTKEVVETARRRRLNVEYSIKPRQDQIFLMP